MRVLDAATLELRASVFPFPEALEGGLRVATGDVNGDGVPDLVAGSGDTSDVVVVDGSDPETVLREIDAFGAVVGGVHVAVGNLGGEPEGDDIVVGSGVGSTPLVRVFDVEGMQLFEIVPFGAELDGGVRVATGDVDGDGVEDLVTAPGPGGSPTVRVFSGASREQLWSRDVFAPTHLAGISVGVLRGSDGRADVVVGGNDSPVVVVVDGTDGGDLFELEPFGGAVPGPIDVAGGSLARGGAPGFTVTSGDLVLRVRLGPAGPRPIGFLETEALPGESVVALPPAASEVLLVNDALATADADAHLAALAIRGMGADRWSVPDRGIEPPPEVLERYSRVLWFTGESMSGVGPTSESEVALTAWWNAGGCLFVDSRDLVTAIPGLSPFLTDVLGVADGTSDVGAVAPAGVGGPFVGLGPYPLLSPPADLSDGVVAAAGAVLAFADDLDAGRGTFRSAARSLAAFLSFPLEAVGDAGDRGEILGAFFDVCPDHRNEIFADGFESGDTSAWGP